MSKSVPATTATAITNRNPGRKPAGNDAPATANGLTLNMNAPSRAKFYVVSGQPTPKSCYAAIQRLNDAIASCRGDSMERHCRPWREEAVPQRLVADIALWSPAVKAVGQV